jgi:hypothetical protein
VIRCHRQDNGVRGTELLSEALVNWVGHLLRIDTSAVQTRTSGFPQLFRACPGAHQAVGRGIDH